MSNKRQGPGLSPDPLRKPSGFKTPPPSRPGEFPLHLIQSFLKQAHLTTGHTKRTAQTSNVSQCGGAGNSPLPPLKFRRDDPNKSLANVPDHLRPTRSSRIHKIHQEIWPKTQRDNAQQQRSPWTHVICHWRSTKRLDKPCIKPEQEN